MEGLEHYGAAPAWIERIRTQRCNPTRPRRDWLRIPPAAPGAGRMTLAELEQHQGKLPAVYAIGRKVVRADVGEGHPFAPIAKVLSGTQVGRPSGFGVA